MGEVEMKFYADEAILYSTSVDLTIDLRMVLREAMHPAKNN